MAAPFVVEGSTPGTQVWAVDAAGNTVQSGTLTAPYFGGNNGTFLGTAVFSAMIDQNAGLNSSGSVNILSTLLIAPQETSGTQIGDITRDYDCYVVCTAGGTNNTLTIGPNSTATAATIFAAATMAAGTATNWKLPAGWYIKFNGTGTFGTQTGISV
jgi:hypothetical protein